MKIPFFLKRIVKRYVFSFYNRMEHLVVVNPMFIEDLVAAGIPREKVTYIPNFVNKEKWHPLPQEEVARLRTELGLSDNQFIVVGAVKFRNAKGLMTLSVWLRNCLRLPLSGPAVSLLVV